jgi:hypothetical protein
MQLVQPVDLFEEREDILVKLLAGVSPGFSPFTRRSARNLSAYSCTIKIPRIIPATTPAEKIKSISFICCAFRK